MTLRLGVDAFNRLERLAAITDRSRAWLAAQAIRDYLELNEWQTRTIALAVKNADQPAARFVEHERVDAWLATWGTPGERALKK